MATEHSGPRACKIARGARSLNCAGPGTATKLIPDALKQTSNLPTKRAGGSAGGASQGGPGRLSPPGKTSGHDR
eukprot:8064957-Alexandrium_andersonii.AAC.1